MTASKSPEPPTDAEFDDMVRRYENEIEIPSRIRTIRQWIDKIQSDPEDIRNTPDVRRSKNGGKFVSGATDLNNLLRHCTTVLTYFEAGERELAQSSLRSLESIVVAVNDRITRPLIEIGKKQTEFGKQNGKQKKLRDIALAREYLARRGTTSQSSTKLMEEIGRPHNLKRKASYNAVKRGLAEIV